MKINVPYDAMGQRIAKTVTNKNVTTGDKFVTTYYVRDPRGNVLAVYEKKEDAAGAGQFQLKERHLYGINRLGMVSQNVTLAQFDNSNVTNGTDPTTPQAGDTHYELTNHLGNVMAVISDEASDTNEPTVVSLSDYYPFGMTEPGRNWNADAEGYRYGFQGHEKEDFDGACLDFGERIYDARLGRWSSIDALYAAFPNHSPYNFVLNNPILLVDPDGMRVAINNDPLGDLAVADLNALLIDNQGRRHDIFYNDNGFLEVQLNAFDALLRSGCSDDVKYIAYAAMYLILMDAQVGFYYSVSSDSVQFDRQPDGNALHSRSTDRKNGNLYEAWVLSTLNANTRREVSCHEFLGHVFYWAAVDASFPLPNVDDQTPNIMNSVHAVSISNLVRRLQNRGPRNLNHAFLDNFTYANLPNWDWDDYRCIRDLVENNSEYKWRRKPKSSGGSNLGKWKSGKKAPRYKKGSYDNKMRRRNGRHKNTWKCK